MDDLLAWQITKAVAATITDLNMTGENVYLGRLYPMDPNKLPGVAVYMGPDELLAEVGNANLDWLLTVVIESYCYDLDEKVDIVLAQIRSEIHNAIMETPAYGLAFVIDTEPGNAFEPEISGEGERPTGKQRLEFRVHYRSSRTAVNQ